MRQLATKIRRCWTRKKRRKFPVDPLDLYYAGTREWAEYRADQLRIIRERWARRRMGVGT